MAVFVSVEPVTNYSSKDLGEELSALTQEKTTRQRLKLDFPGVVKRYKNPRSGRASIERMQNRMVTEPGLYALVVRLGTKESSLQTSGIITLTPSPVPHKKGAQPGLNIAAWLSASRPPALRNTGHRLVRPVMNIILDCRSYSEVTRLWTLVRTENPAAMELVNASWGKLQFYPDGSTQSFKSLDGVRAKRLLMVSRPLEFLR